MQIDKTQFMTLSRSAGFTLIEVLVSVLVLSIGLLGLASLQATSLRFNNDSSAQTQASYLASDMADRMRANVNKLAAYVAQSGSAGTEHTNCYTGGCSQDEMVENDFYEWQTSLDTLPSGQGTITALPGGLYTITVMWDEQRSGVNGTNCDPDDTNDLRCVSITTNP